MEDTNQANNQEPVTNNTTSEEVVVSDKKLDAKSSKLEAKKMRWDIRPGMTVKVHQKIREITPKGEEKERVQIFEGMVLGIRGSGASRTFTVRKESYGVGVEKIFPMDLPTLVNVEPVKQAKVRRAKLYYLKGYGKKLKEKSVK